MSAAGYVPFAVGTRVRVVRRGSVVSGKIVEVVLDPNRRPGIGRVSYSVEIHPVFHPILVAAKCVFVDSEKESAR